MSADEQAEQAKDVIRRFVEEVQNQKNWDVYDELNDPDFFDHSAPPGMTERREASSISAPSLAASRTAASRSTT